jgi:hypothetical protein
MQHFFFNYSKYIVGRFFYKKTGRSVYLFFFQEHHAEPKKARIPDKQIVPIIHMQYSVLIS